MASVRKRKWTHKGVEKEAWVVTYTDHAGKRRQGGTFERKKDADRARQNIEAELEQGTHTPNRDTVTFGEAAKAYIKDIERRHRVGDKMAGGTLYTKRSLIENHLIPMLGGRKLTTIDHLTLQDTINKLAETMKKSTLASHASEMKLIFTFAVRRKWLKLHPLASQKLNVPGRNIKRAIPTKEEIELILRALATRYYRESETGHRIRVLSTVLALFGGLRRGEVCGLQWENVDFVRNEIKIKHSLSHYDGLKDPKSRAGFRTIPMTSPVRQALLWAREFEGCDGTGFVLRSRNGGPLTPSNVYWYWTATMEQAGLVKPAASKGVRTVTPKYPFHSLRHASVSLLIAEGLQPLHIKTFIGHHSVRTTIDIYGHLFPEDAATGNALDAASSRFNFGVESRDSYGGHNAAPRQIRDKTLQVLEITSDSLLGQDRHCARPADDGEPVRSGLSGAAAGAVFAGGSGQRQQRHADPR